jgi:hypothetical protein
VLASEGLAIFTTRAIVDDGTEFTPSVELCLLEPCKKAGLVVLSGQLVSNRDIDEMAAVVMADLREWKREAKAALAKALAQRARDGVPVRLFARR